MGDVPVAAGPVPRWSQFSNASFTPWSAARLASGRNTAPNRGIDSGTGRPGIRPANPETILQPKSAAASMRVSQSTTVSGLTSGLP